MPDGTTTLIVSAIPGLLALVGVIITAIRSGAKDRGDRQARSRDMAPPDWPTAWARMDMLEAKLVAAVRLFQSARDQWPEGAPPPVFDEADLAEIEDTLPARWRTLPRARKA